MQRPALILHQLETSLSVAPDALARLLGVGMRTVATEVANLNSMLAGSGQVRLINGRYRLRVVDNAAFEEARRQVTGVKDSFNDPQHRVSHILAQLVLSTGPVRIETLARGMNVGRTTVTADLVTLRRLLAEMDVRVQGRPHVGLQLQGDELAIRLAVLRHAYRRAYGSYPLGTALLDILDEACAEFSFDEGVAMEVVRWMTVALDRRLSGHGLDELPQSHEQLTGTDAHAFAIRVAQGIERVTGESLPSAEVLYLAIPAAGRRTPMGTGVATRESVEAETRMLVDQVFARIADVLEIDVQPRELLTEFTQHVGFMVNRMRYGLSVEADLDVPELRVRFPLAVRMAELASDVVREQVGLTMDETELALAATYFQVFLDDSEQQGRRPFRIGIHTRRGPAAASLLKGQLGRALSVPTEYLLVSSAQEVTDKGVDLLVTAPGTSLDVAVPTIELSELFDRGELINKLSRMHFPHFGPLLNDRADGSMLVLLLGPDRIVQLPAGCGHDEAATRLAHHLADLGLVDEFFLDALAERLVETEPVLVGDRLAFPHASSPGLASVSCALGLVAATDEEPARLVFLMAVPEKENYDDQVLIRTYEELIRVGTNPRLMDRLCAISTYPDLLGLFEDLRDHNQGN
ncbi:BglG family transcription antiterminator [Luteococcus japonicus]|uniref:Sorbitol operon transcription regulator n=1 Tax=Luteococcus japonicus LSP_Lj1 TaxID=1255658 RepID=A0A1R4J592_9ACTN|nr:PRD domain-containing protein [Luteococcus japonicus]SJN27094.1 Sorbitol operon transcription regulator [Luteococcus japonicus LSP_Lj1]